MAKNGNRQVAAWVAPDPDAPNVRADLLSRDQMDVVTYCLIAASNWDSCEVHRDATPYEIAFAGDGSRIHGHFGSSSPRYYSHYDDENWAVIHRGTGDARRGMDLLLQVAPEGYSLPPVKEETNDVPD